jgi:hypothetical protein
VTSPFRDPLDGALRRAERLEEENAQLRAEVEQLRREGAPKKDEKRASKKDEERASGASPRLWGAAVGGVCTATYFILKLVVIGHHATYTPSTYTAPRATTHPTTQAASDEASPSVFYAKKAQATWLTYHAAAPSAPTYVAVGERGTVLVGDRVTQAPSTSDLRGVVTFQVPENGRPKTSALVVGDGGLVLRCRDLTAALEPATQAGAWIREDVPTKASLRGVATDGKTSWIVGEAGIILHQSAPGTKWRAETSGTSEDLAAVALTPTKLYAVGKHGLVLTSDLDGAAVWTKMQTPIMADLNAVWADATEAWIAGDEGTLLQRVGAAWHRVRVRTDAPLRTVSVLRKRGERIVVATGDHGLVVVGEGGKWYVEYAYNDDLLAIGQSGEHLFAAGRNGAIVDLKIY